MLFTRILLAPLIFTGLALPVVAEEEDFNTQLMRATVKISHDKSTATGFVLAAPEGNKFILVTAAHVLSQTPDDETTVVFRSQESEGNYKKAPMKLVIRKEGRAAWTKHPTEDVAAMWIVPPSNADLPRLPLTLLALDESIKQRQVHPGEIVACLGFPHRNEGSEAGFPLLRSGAIASFPLVPTAKTKTLLLSANVFEGDSGGPVYLTRPSRKNADKEDVQLILGLVSGQRFLDEEAKLVYGTTKLRHRLGLAVVVHAFFIKETIDRLP